MVNGDNGAVLRAPRSWQEAIPADEPPLQAPGISVVALHDDSCCHSADGVIRTSHDRFLDSNRRTPPSASDFLNSSKMASAMVRAGVGSAVSQVVQGKWSWREVGASTVAGGAGYLAGEAVGSVMSGFDPTVTNVAVGAAAGVAGSWASSQVMGYNTAGTRARLGQAFINGLAQGTAEMFVERAGRQGEGPWSSGDYQNGSDLQSERYPAQRAADEQRTAAYEQLVRALGQGPSARDASEDYVRRRYERQAAACVSSCVARSCQPERRLHRREWRLSLRDRGHVDKHAAHDCPTGRAGRGLWAGVRCGRQEAHRSSVLAVSERDAERSLAAGGGPVSPSGRLLRVSIFGAFGEGFANPNGGFLERAGYFAFAAGVAPFAVLEGAATGFYNSLNNASRMGQKLARADLITDPDNAFLSRGDAFIDGLSAFTGLGGAATLIPSRLAVSPLLPTVLADDMLAESNLSSFKPSGKVEYVPAPRTVVARDFNLVLSKQNGLLSTLSKEGIVDFKINAVNSPVRGTEMFDKMMVAYGDDVSAIRGNWMNLDLGPDNKNLGMLNKLTSQGVPLESAVLQTWTAKQAGRYGFTSPSVQIVVGNPGAYTKVETLFTKP